MAAATIQNVTFTVKKYYLESRSRRISYTKLVNARLTGSVTFCVETAFYDRLLKGDRTRDRSDRKMRKKM
jgi:hypothetical protein